MNIIIKLSETNSALLNRVVKEEKLSASDFVNGAIFNEFQPVAPNLGIESAFILQEHDAGTLDEWHIKQSISRAIRFLSAHPIQDCAILEKIFEHFPFCAEDNGEISTCNEYVQAEMERVVAIMKERVPGYAPSKNEYGGLVEDVLTNWEYIWKEAIVYDVLSTIVFVHEPKKDFDWYDGLNFLYLIDRAAWRQWCDA